MIWISRGFDWWLDYLYVAYWQVRHFLGGRSASHYLNGDRKPVLLLPGVYETWQFLKPVADRLHAQGHPVHVVATLGYNRGRVSDMAALAHRYLVDNDLEDVTIIAHSKGGLIGKHLMVVEEADAANSRISRMIAINTPFAGSVYARYLPGQTLRAFSPTESTLLMLAANAEANARIVSVYSGFDPHIPGGSRLEGATNIELPLNGHFRPLGARLLIETVVRAVHP